MLCSATALLGRTASTTLAGRLYRLLAFLLVLDNIFTGAFFYFFCLFDILLLNLFR